MSTKVVKESQEDEILEIVTHLATSLEKNDYKNLAGSIRSAKSKYTRKKADKKEHTDEKEQLIEARRLLTKSLINTYNFFYFKEELINIPINFLKNLDVKDGVYYYGNQKVSLNGLKDNQEALSYLREVFDFANKSEYLDESTLNGWGLWQQIKM